MQDRRRWVAIPAEQAGRSVIHLRPIALDGGDVAPMGIQATPICRIALAAAAWRWQPPGRRPGTAPSNGCYFAGMRIKS